MRHRKLRSVPVSGVGLAGRAPSSLLTGLEAYYRFQNNRNDQTANARNLSSAFESYVAGKLGQGVTGTTGTMQATGLSVALTDCAVSAWVKFIPDAASVSAAFFRAWDGGGFNTIVGVLGQGGADMLATWSAVGATDITSSVSSGWHHMVSSVSGGNLTAWLDGVVVGTQPFAAGGTMSAIQASAPTVDNALDECALYSRALTPALVALLYNAGAGFDPTA